MSILLAIAEPTISNGIRKVLVEHGLTVLKDEVLHRKYLNETIELLSPSMVIIHDYFLPSELEDPEERDQEILQMIEHWRMVYDTDLRIVYLCVRDRHDPFLGQLVARNVLDIFYEQGLDTKRFAIQLSQPPRYANVQKFGKGQLDIKFMENEEPEQEEKVLEQSSESGDSDERESSGKVSVIERAAKISSKVAEGAKRGAEDLKGKLPKRNVSESEKVHKENHSNDDAIMEDILDLMPEELIASKSSKPAIIGTVLISVAGVKPHLGSTHTALSIASYLKKLGHAVAVVEVNHSQDFDRIHSMYEGEKHFFTSIDTFELNGITHYKYRENIDLNNLYSAYEYVIMDYGDLENAAAYDEEFRRAHVRVVVCSADEWKFHWIEDFLKYNELDKRECVFVVPLSTNAKLKDLQDRLDYQDVYAIPIQDNPYDLNKETVEVLINILGPYLKSPHRTFSKKSLVITSVISVAITLLILAIFNYLG